MNVYIINVLRKQQQQHHQKMKVPYKTILPRQQQQKTILIISLQARTEREFMQIILIFVSFRELFHFSVVSSIFVVVK